MEIIGFTQNYAWGKRGSKSLVATFARSNANVVIDENQTYAEFWIGTHPSGPSVLKDSNESLSEYLKKNSSKLGKEVMDIFGQEFPFLFKILSIQKGLSIQVHPSKTEAEQLHMVMPDVYKDPNHKPELAIALTEFQALHGFRPQKEIQFYLKNVSEFSVLIDSQKINNFINSLEENSIHAMKECFWSLMTCPESVVKSAVCNLISRLEKSDQEVRNVYHFDVVIKLNNEFPGDIGIFCVYWLNYIVLQPGEAFFCAPNEPHAYLSGDCIECMANSDNVIRAGLTPKFRDVPRLCSMLSYKSIESRDVLFKPVKESEFCSVFRPPVKDFAVAKIEIPSKKDYIILKRTSASVLIVIEGQGVNSSGSPLKPGSAFFIPSGEQFCVKCSEKITIFQAFCNV